MGLSNNSTLGDNNPDYNFLEDYSSFSVVIAGEYNSGKSTIINALVGTKLLETGSLPTTDAVTLITHDAADEDDEDESARLLLSEHGIVHHRVPLPLLQDLTLVDTPGTNAVLRDHTVTTLRLLPAADLILFVTSADRPFPESERALLESMAAYNDRQSILVVINKMDVLNDAGGDYGAEEKQRVVEFVSNHAATLLGARPTVLAVSARDALAAKLTRGSTSLASSANNNTATNAAAPHQSSAVWQRSNFASLESFLRDSLTTDTKIKAKLRSPLAAAEGRLDQCRVRLRADRQELEADAATLNLLQSQLAAGRQQIEAELHEAARDMCGRVRAEGARGAVLLRRTSGVWDFYAQSGLTTVSGTNDNNSGRQQLQRAWDKTKPTATLAAAQTPSSSPSSTTPQTVQAELLEFANETAASVATRSRAQGQAVIEFLGHRSRLHNHSLVGRVTAASRFEETRQQLAHNLRRSVELHVDLDEAAVQESLLVRWQQAAWLSAGLNVGAVGSVVATATQWIDVVPGLVGAAALGTASALLVTVGRPQLVQQLYADRWAACGEGLEEDLQVLCAQEGERLARRIRDGVTPYTRFVEAEHERIARLSDQCDRLQQAAQRLRKRINNL